MTETTLLLVLSLIIPTKDHEKVRKQMKNGKTIASIAKKYLKE